MTDRISVASILNTVVEADTSNFTGTDIIHSPSIESLSETRILPLSSSAPTSSIIQQQQQQSTHADENNHRIPSISELFSTLSRPALSSNTATTYNNNGGDYSGHNSATRMHTPSSHQSSSEYGPRSSMELKQRSFTSHPLPQYHEEAPRLFPQQQQHPPHHNIESEPGSNPSPQSLASMQTSSKNNRTQSIAPRPYRRTRENLPKQTTNSLKTWLMTHTHNPYPSDQEKRIMCDELNLTIVQLNNWFINGRRRYLKRTVDESYRQVHKYNGSNGSGNGTGTSSGTISLNSSLNDSIGRAAFSALRLNGDKDPHSLVSHDSENSSLENSWSSMPSLSGEKDPGNFPSE